MSPQKIAETPMSERLTLTPLRKKRLEGALYTRLREVEEKIHELLLLSHEEVIARTQITERNDAAFIPGEALLYLVRAYKTECGSPYYKKLYYALTARLLRGLPPAETSDGKSLALTATRVVVQARGGLPCQFDPIHFMPRSPSRRRVSQSKYLPRLVSAQTAPARWGLLAWRPLCSCELR